MRVRSLLLAVLLVAGLAGAPAAHARPRKPVCHLVKDVAADETVSEPALDVRGADLASDGRRLTALVRLGGHPDTSAPTSPLGRVYTFRFRGAGDGEFPVFLSYVTTPTTKEASYGFHDPVSRQDIERGPATVKVTASSVAVTVPLVVLEPFGKFHPGSVLSEPVVESLRVLGARTDLGTDLRTGADIADGTGTYVAGSRSCVPVGG